MTTAFEFDSDEFPPDEAFEEYRALYAGGSDVGRIGEFRAHVRSLNLDGVILFERRITGVVHSRVARAGLDQFRHLVIHLVVEGEFIGSKESEFEVARKGDLVVADTARPSHTQAVGLHLLSASVPRNALVRVAGTERLHGIMAGAPETDLLADFMMSCMRNGTAMPIDRRRGLASAFVDVLAAVLDRDPASGGTDRSRTETVQRKAALRFIRGRLSNRNLNADMVAEAIALSRRSLYRLFEPLGGVSRVIMESRVEAVRTVIEAGSKEPLAVLAAEYGFSDESHLSRRFQEAHGEPISAFRKRILTEGPTQACSRRLQTWMRSVR